jgi:hypothetical protein
MSWARVGVRFFVPSSQEKATLESTVSCGRRGRYASASGGRDDGEARTRHARQDACQSSYLGFQGVDNRTKGGGRHLLRKLRHVPDDAGDGVGLEALSMDRYLLVSVLGFG